MQGCVHGRRVKRIFFLSQFGRQKRCSIVECESCTYRAVYVKDFPPVELRGGWEYWNLRKRYPGIYMEDNVHKVAKRS